MPARPLPAAEPKPLDRGDRRHQGEDVLHVGVRSQQRVRDSGGGQAASISAWPRRRAIGESADALLVALTMCPTPARAALAMTFSSCAGTAGLTRMTAVTSASTASRLAGTSRSPTAISAPACASDLAFSWSRTRTRTGIARSASRRAASVPTFPAVVTRIMAGPSCTEMGYTAHNVDLLMGCQTQNDARIGAVDAETQHRPRLTPKGARTRARIVDAAVRLVHERGVAGTTLDDVRVAAEVSGSQLSH